MNVEKDTFIMSLAWDINDETTCQFKECPKYGWILLAFGFDTEPVPTGAFKLCPTHAGVLMDSWHKDFVPKIIADLQKCDRKDYGLDEHYD